MHMHIVDPLSFILFENCLHVAVLFLYLSAESALARNVSRCPRYSRKR